MQVSDHGLEMQELTLKERVSYLGHHSGAKTSLEVFLKLPEAVEKFPERRQELLCPLCRQEQKNITLRRGQAMRENAATLKNKNYEETDA